MLRLLKTQISSEHGHAKRAIALAFLMIASTLAISAHAEQIKSRSEQPTPPSPPLCEKLYPGAEAGLLSCNNETQAGWTVFSATSHDQIYMIDERGERRHQWTSTHPNGSSFGIDIGANGSLLQMLNDLPIEAGPQLMEAGGSATHIEILDANSQLLWEITEYANTYRLHHDATFLPNGNVLAIAWEYIDQGTALSMGREESKLSSDGLWPDVVIEYAPTETGEASIVWMWKASDHLVQDQNQMLPTYGTPSEHPGKIDINAVGPNSREDDADWMHCNSIDYDPIHQHILLSCRHTEELYIINHNLTWEESNTTEGDLLYRWGNPLNYGLGSSSDHHTVVQHDATFIPPGRPFAGSISYFSNEMSGPSVVGIITPQRNADGFVLNKTTGTYDPPRPTEEFMLPSGWGPRFQSGATLLPNGQFLVSHSLRGKLGQIGNDSAIDWEYNIPLNPGGEIASRTQRMLPPVYFKAEWLETSDVRVQNLPLQRQGVIELYDDLCPEDGDDIVWDWNGDGCIEDDDQDGVTNDGDWCPNSASGEDVDEFGCFAELEEILGCTDETALNYNPEAEVDDESCEYPPPEVVGCMDETATNHNANATQHDPALCEYPPPDVAGCMDETALNYDELATVDDASCTYPPPPPPPTEGCHDKNATNWNLSTDSHNASLCIYPEQPETPDPVRGCTNLTAVNYASAATEDDGSCIFVTEEANEPPVDEPSEGEQETPCDARGDCPVDIAESERLGANSGQIALVIGLSMIAAVLAVVVIGQLSRQMYGEED